MSDNSSLSPQLEGLLIDSVREMSAYHVQDASGMLKLDAMENPFPWSGELMSLCFDAISRVEINRYPDPDASLLKAKVRQAMQIPEELDILLGNGSDEIIQILAMALARKDASLLSVEPSFVMYKIIADSVGMHYHPVKLTDKFELDLPAILSVVEQEQPALLFFAVPNNPTGNCFDRSALESIIKASDGLVVIDEAYIAFTESDLIELALKYDNVIVMRTLSKLGLAGLRLGMLFGRPEWLSHFNKIRLPYNINVLTQAVAAIALDNYDIFLEQASELKHLRSSLVSELTGSDHLEVFPSQANFILVRLLKHDARTVFEGLKEKGVLIKCLAGGHPLLNNCLRITVGDSSQNKQFLAAFNEILTA